MACREGAGSARAGAIPEPWELADGHRRTCDHPRVSGAASLDEVRRRWRALRPAVGDPDAYFEALLDVVSAQGTRFVGACWHLTDPATGAFTWAAAAGEMPGDFASAIENEFLEDDVAKYSELATRRQAVATLVDETDGQPRRSLRYRRSFEPDGFADELRAVFADPFGRWGSIALVSDAPFAASDKATAEALAPIVARSLREEVARAAPVAGDESPGLLVLDADDRVRSRDARSSEILAGCAQSGSLPGAVHVLAARARAHAGPVAGRMLARGTWIAIHASPLVDEPGAVALVLRAAPRASVLDVRLRAAGLTEREREIGFALVRGDDTATIAASLFLSAWTVQDHLKAIFDKTGVRSRRAFVARWALEALEAPIPAG